MAMRKGLREPASGTGVRRITLDGRPRCFTIQACADTDITPADLPRAPRSRRDQRADLREHVRSYVAVMALLLAIWLLTGAGYPWPVWPAMGWGIGLLSHAGGLGRPPRLGAPRLH